MGSMGKISTIICLLVFVGSSWSVDLDCDFEQQMSPGVTYYIYNKEYPGYYHGQKVCRWVATAPEGYNVDLQCTLDLPNSENCSMDRLLVSTTGNIDLSNASNYCGTGAISLQSEFNNITLELVSASDTPGGRFLCNITAGCACGWKNSIRSRRIVGSEETGVNEFPAMVGLLDTVSRAVYCGATIIAPKYAVSSAHCNYNRDPRHTIFLVGDHDTSTGTDTPSARVTTVSRFIIHEDFNQVTNKNDISLVITTQEIEFNRQVGPACLPFRYSAYLFTGQPVQLVGWGRTEYGGPRSDVLQKTTVNVLSPTLCKTKTNGSLNQMCTYRDGHSACEFDAGGPVFWLDQTTHREYLVGVISYGSGCATSTPTVNTRITSYLDWIIKNSPDAQYCRK